MSKIIINKLVSESKDKVFENIWERILMWIMQKNQLFNMKLLITNPRYRFYNNCLKNYVKLKKEMK